MSPSCPEVFNPQPNNSPFSLTARVCADPAVTSVILLLKNVGNDLPNVEPSPIPNWNEEFKPQT